MHFMCKSHQKSPWHQHCYSSTVPPSSNQPSSIPDMQSFQTTFSFTYPIHPFQHKRQTQGSKFQTQHCAAVHEDVLLLQSFGALTGELLCLPPTNRYSGEQTLCPSTTARQHLQEASMPRTSQIPGMAVSAEDRLLPAGPTVLPA